MGEQEKHGGERETWGKTDEGQQARENINMIQQPKHKSTTKEKKHKTEIKETRAHRRHGGAGLRVIEHITTTTKSGTIDTTEQKESKKNKKKGGGQRD